MEMSKPQSFGSKPQMSSYSAMSTSSQSAASFHNSPKQQNNFSKAVVPANKKMSPMPSGGNQVQIFSNQYRLKLSENTAVYQYVIDIKPDEMWEAERVHAIIKTKRSALEKALGPFVVSGSSIYILNEIDDSVEFTTSYRG